MRSLGRILLAFVLLHFVLKGQVKKVKVAQSCLILWEPMDYSVHGILQARILEWVTIPFSRGSSQPRDRTQVSSLAAQSVKNLPAMQETPVRFLGWEDPLEKE